MTQVRAGWIAQAIQSQPRKWNREMTLHFQDGQWHATLNFVDLNEEISATGKDIYSAINNLEDKVAEDAIEEHLAGGTT